MNNEILKRWESLGLLEGLTDDKKQIVAEKMDELAKFLLPLEDVKYYDVLEVIAFPIVRGIFSTANEEDLKDFSFEKLCEYFEVHFEDCLAIFSHNCIDHFTKK